MTIKDKLYRIVHWIGVSPNGLRADESPAGGFVSDQVVTIALREFQDEEEEMRILNSDDPSLFETNFLVNSLDGETSKPLNSSALFRIWLVFTLYMRHVMFTKEEDPRGQLLDKVLDLISGAMKTSAAVLVKSFLMDMLDCDTCERRSTCEAFQSKGDENKQGCDEESKRWN